MENLDVGTSKYTGGTINIRSKHGDATGSRVKQNDIWIVKISTRDTGNACESRTTVHASDCRWGERLVADLQPVRIKAFLSENHLCILVKITDFEAYRASNIFVLGRNVKRNNKTVSLYRIKSHLKCH